MQNQLKGMSEEMKTLRAQSKEAVETIKQVVRIPCLQFT